MTITGSISDGGGYTLMTCISGSIFCGVVSSNTTRTCDVFGCRTSSVYPGVGISSLTCSSFLYGDCGGQWGGIYGWSRPYEPTPSPAF